MKSFISSIVILFAVIVLTSISAVLISANLGRIKNDVEAIDVNNDSFDTIYEKTKLTEKDFKRCEILLDFLIDDSDKHMIEDYINDMKSAVEAESLEEITIAKSRLISEAEKIRRLCSINIDAIF